MSFAPRAFFSHCLRVCALILCIAACRIACAQNTPSATAAWMNKSLSPDERAALVVKEMSLDEKISLLHGTGMKGLSPMSPLAVRSNGGADCRQGEAIT